MRRARLTAIVGVLAAAVMTSCATRTHETIHRRNTDAGMVCGEKFPDVDYWWDTLTGQLMVNVKIRGGGLQDHSGFAACVQAEIERRAPGHSGRLPETSPSHAIVGVYVDSGLIMAPVTVNGTFHGRLIVDTGASLTMLTTDTVRSLGITVPADGPHVRLSLADGTVLQRPVITIASLRVGDMIVEDLEVVVSERRLPGDGLLGQNFLRHFGVLIERERNRLVLDTGRAAAPPRVTGTPTRVWAAPVSAWSVGDT